MSNSLEGVGAARQSSEYPWVGIPELLDFRLRKLSRKPSFKEIRGPKIGHS